MLVIYNCIFILMTARIPVCVNVKKDLLKVKIHISSMYQLSMHPTV